MKFFASIPSGYVNGELPEGDYLITAAQFWKKDKFRIPSLIPDRNFFIDCGAYTFREKEMPYTFEEYFNFCSHFKPVAIALFDVPGDSERTLDLLLQQLQSLQKLDSSHIVPVITGDTLQDYQDCFKRSKELFKKFNFKPKFLAIGNLKNRTNTTEIVSGLHSMNSEKYFFHLFGSGLEQLREAWKIPGIGLYSIDNGCWNGRFANGIDEFNAVMKTQNKTQQRTALDYFLPKYRSKVSSITRTQNLELLL